VLATALLIFAFVLIGLAVVFVALRGQEPSTGAKGRGGRLQQRAWGIGLMLVLVLLGIGVPALAIVDNSDNSAQRAPKGVKLTEAEANGRKLFHINCATCHSLAASNAVGRVGPDLDTLSGGNMQAAFVLDAIKNGRNRGAGNMPANLLQGQDAKDVASYVSRVAGR
jgi:mono/diheme cytochrome c family protein